jgi:hypothetical protein
MSLTEDQFNALYSIAVDSYPFSAEEDKYDGRIALLKEMKLCFNPDTIVRNSISHQNDLRTMNILGYITVKRYTDSSAVVRYGGATITEDGWSELVVEYEQRKQYGEKGEWLGSQK